MVASGGELSVSLPLSFPGLDIWSSGDLGFDAQSRFPTSLLRPTTHSVLDGVIIGFDW